MCERRCYHRWVYAERLDLEVCVKCHQDRQPKAEAAPRRAA